MHNSPPDATRAAQTVIAVVRKLSAERPLPILIALDGPSGAGKSALAIEIANAFDATVVPSDDFFAAEISATGWQARSASDRAADAIDWRRLRRDALEPLLAMRPARWQAFDFEAGLRPDGTYAMQQGFVERRPAPVILVEGAYSSRPELDDLIDLSVLVDAPVAVRHARLSGRDAPSFQEAWHARWDAAEAHYFTFVRPPELFDLVVSTGGPRR
jgi:uridine kinase